MTTLIGYMQELGWDPYANDHEDANCQFEINWTYADALTTADRHTFFKWMVRTVAEQHGLWATFHAETVRPSHRQRRALHMSLWDAETGKNLFLDESDTSTAFRELGRWFMGGLLHHARGLAAIVAPLVNSYKRLIRGAPRSGATWAPVYVTYGVSNRTQMIRIPAPGRIENRIVDGRRQPVSGVPRPCWRPASTASRTRSIPARSTATIFTRCRSRNFGGGILASCRLRFKSRWTVSSAMRCCNRRSEKTMRRIMRT